MITSTIVEVVFTCISMRNRTFHLNNASEIILLIYLFMSAGEVIDVNWLASLQQKFTKSIHIVNITFFIEKTSCINSKYDLSLSSSSWN